MFGSHQSLPCEAVMSALAVLEKFDLNQEDMHRPKCLKCNLGMWLFADVNEHSGHRRTYVCEVCGTTEVVRV
jgi:hypothetical protein